MIHYSQKIIINIKSEDTIDIFKDNMSAKLFKDFLIKKDVGILLSEDFFIRQKNEYYGIEFDLSFGSIEELKILFEDLCNNFIEGELKEMHEAYLEDAINQMNKVKSFSKFRESSGTSLYEFSGINGVKSNKYSFHIGKVLIGIFIEEFGKIKFSKLPDKYINKLEEISNHLYGDGSIYTLSTSEVFYILNKFPEYTSNIINDLKLVSHIDISYIINNSLKENLFSTEILNNFLNIDYIDEKTKNIIYKEIELRKNSDLEEFEF